MRILFIHQNFPGQYKHLAAAMAVDPANEVVALADESTAARQPHLPGVRLVTYSKPIATSADVHPHLRPLENATHRGYMVWQRACALRTEGFVPDVICVHPGWGEALFLRDVFPDARILGYQEFFYRSTGSDVGFDPEYSGVGEDLGPRLRLRNAPLLLSMESFDHGIAPTRWQRAQLPEAHARRCAVIHDGIDCDAITPAPNAFVTLKKAGLRLTARDEVVTYVARNLEPYRGFHVFMRMLPRLQKLRPNVHVIVIGGDEVSYTPASRTHKSYKAQMLAEMGSRIDMSRVHFVGKVPYRVYLSALRVSSAHLYLTYPFVLSWSCLEAMAAGCLVVASRTAPVEEVITDGDNGKLVDFFDVDGIADMLADAIERRDEMCPMRARARETVRARYDLRSVCLPAQTALLHALAEGRMEDVAHLSAP